MLTLRLPFATTSLVALLLCGCKKDEAPTSEPGPPVARPEGTAVSEQTRSPVVSELPAFVLLTTVVKREPNEKAKVDEKGKLVANWLATLVRGEEVSLLDTTEGDYRRVKTSDEVEGWVKRQSVRAGSEIAPAAVLEDAEVFDRPDPLALNSKKQIIAGSLVFSSRTKEQFGEVNVAGLGTVWVLQAKLTTEEPEVAVARLLSRARELTAGNNTDGANDLLHLAKSTFPSSRLVAGSSEFEGIVVDTPEGEGQEAGQGDGSDEQNAVQEGGGRAADSVREKCPDCDGLRECLKGRSGEECSRQFPNDATECVEWCKE